jgi:hypothetical protein
LQPPDDEAENDGHGNDGEEVSVLHDTLISIVRRRRDEVRLSLRWYDVGISLTARWYWTFASVSHRECVNRNDAAMGMGRYLLGTNAASSPRTTQMKVDSLLYAGNNLDKARDIFTKAIKHRPRIRLTMRQRRRVLQSPFPLCGQRVDLCGG